MASEKWTSNKNENIFSIIAGIMKFAFQQIEPATT